ncbi:hypothetical protein [Candidatus Lokiarchaeum ossiferum]|uniref:hypothetical protein n=1 Tax=Candidatus Lokiarchaeum ossiferum TaxID=2951803 RepID=UPI00352C1187
MENQSDSELKIHRSIIITEGVIGFLKYLNLIREQRPFNLTTISESLNLPHEEVSEYFSIIQHAFRLFHNIQHDKIIQEDDIFAHSQKKTEHISLTYIEMERYSTFAYLSSKKPFSSLSEQIMSLFHNHKDLFHEIREENNIFFKVSPVGKYFATEFRKLKMLNLPVDRIEYKNYELIIKN